MKISKVISCLLSIILVFSSFQMLAFADSNDFSEAEITFEFYNEVSEATKKKIISHFTGDSKTIIEERGITCTLFGHDIETGSTAVVTHKVKTTAPRCLRETYSYEICSRCDYEEYTFLYSEYIYCCS